MRDFSIHAKPTSNKNKLTFLILFSISAMLFVTSGVFDKYKSIVGFIALLFATAAFFVLTKYVLAEYYYDISATDTEDPIFVVRQRVGKRSTTLCRISIRSIVRIEELSRSEYKKHTTEAGYAKYVYSPTLFAEKLIYIKVSSHYEHAELFIEGTTELAKMLSDYSAQLRAQSPENDE